MFDSIFAVFARHNQRRKALQKLAMLIGKDLTDLSAKLTALHEGAAAKDATIASLKAQLAAAEPEAARLAALDATEPQVRAALAL